MTTMIDSSIWVAFINQSDSCHKKALGILSDISPEGIRLYDHIYTETLTVLRNKTTFYHCKAFLQFINDRNIPINVSDEEILKYATKIFFDKQRLSFTDCLLLASADLTDSNIKSFDKDLSNAWESLSN